MKKCVSTLFLDRKGRQRMKAKCKAALTKMTIQVDPWGTKSFRICIHRRRRCCGRTIRDRLLLLAKLNCNGSGKTFETVKQLSVHKKHNFTETRKVWRALNLNRESLTCPNFSGVLVVSLKFVIQTPVSLKRKWRKSTCQNSSLMLRCRTFIDTVNIDQWGESIWIGCSWIFTFRYFGFP